jgi:hypothetical protein
MTSSRPALFALLLVLGLPASAAAQRTAQDIESARQLYNQGIALRDKGDVKGALDKFRAAHALGNTPLTGIELCRTYAAMSKPVEAREVCLGIARIPVLPQETARSKEARAEAARIAESEQPKIGSVRVRLTGVPPGAEPLVLVDGAAIPPAALGEPRAIDPGSHVITAKVGDGPETRTTLETREGETRDIDLAVQAPPPPVASAPPSPAANAQSAPAAGADKERKNTLATVSFAVAGVSALIAVVSGIKAISAEGDLDKKCIAKQCGQELYSDLDSARTWGNVSTAFFIIGGVALGTGLVSTFVLSKGSSNKAQVKVAPVIGLGGAGLNGSF